MRRLGKCRVRVEGRVPLREPLETLTFYVFDFPTIALLLAAGAVSRELLVMRGMRESRSHYECTRRAATPFADAIRCDRDALGSAR